MKDKILLLYIDPFLTGVQHFVENLLYLFLFTFVTQKSEEAPKVPEMDEVRVDKDEKNVLLFRSVCNMLFNSCVKQEGDVTLTRLFPNSTPKRNKKRFFQIPTCIFYFSGCCSLRI